MATIGIVCELNPLHKGHEYLLKEAKKRGDEVILVMSGHFTERGDAAILDKYARTEAALRLGADLVLELPFPYSAASASYFAGAGVDILSSAGADCLLFGSETADAESLKKAAAASLSVPAKGSPMDYFSAVGEKLGEAFHPAPNDILALAYATAVEKKKLPMALCPVERRGDSFASETLSESPYASAGAIRRALLAGDQKALSYLPSVSADIFRSRREIGEAPASLSHAERFLLGFLRMQSPENLSDIAELGNGLESRLIEAAKNVFSYEELVGAVAAKHLTTARIRRALLYAVTGVRYSDLDASPAYTLLLGANEKGRERLSFLRRREQSIPILTKPADAKDLSPEAARAFELSLRADSLYTLCLPTPAESRKYAKMSPILL